MQFILGILLVVIGLSTIIWGGFNLTSRETIIEIGPITATRETDRPLPLPALASAAALASGSLLLATNKRK